MTVKQDQAPGRLDRRAFLANLARTGVAARLAPAFAVAALSPAPADAGVFDSPHARRTMDAFADTVMPPDEDGPGGAAVGFCEVLYDPSFLEVFAGFRIPLSPAVRLLVADLDRRALFAARARFADATPEEQDEILARALEGRLRLAYEGMIALVKIVYFGGQRDTAGWDVIGYPGPSDAYEDACPPGPPPAPPMTDDGNPP